MLRRISEFSAGRRSKWLVIAAWVILVAAVGGYAGKLQASTTNENEEYLPASADSTAVINLLEDRFPEGREVDAIVVYQRQGGLTAADKREIQAEAAEFCASPEIKDKLTVVSPFAGPVCGVDGEPVAAEGAAAPGGGAEAAPPGALSPVSEDGSTALTFVRTSATESEVIQETVGALREITPPPDAGEGELNAYVSGPAGFITDATEAFEEIDGTLLTVTIALVLILLLLIYRSPVIAFVPLFVVGIAYTIVAAGIYGIVEAGVFDVNGQTTGILIVLMFGAGTDYCLLIVSRYREELRRYEDKHEAMAHATERTAPAIVSAGATVFAAMLVLLLADLKSTQSMGPVLAIGIAVTLLAGLTLLPAVLAALGRRAFWPAVPRVGSEQRQPLGVWRRVGNLVHERAPIATVVCIGVLALGALGNLTERGTLDFGEGFRNDPESSQGQEVIDEQLSAGQVAVTNVIVDDSGATVEEVTAALNDSDDVDSAQPVSVSDDGELARIDVTLAQDPFTDAASDSIPGLRETVEESAGGGTALVGGLTAENHDTEQTLASDAKLIVPLILILILLILIALLRAVVAPLYLVATVVLSFAFALGVSQWLFTNVFDQPDGEPGLATFSFLFLVALGVDYNIFLISRIREESAKLGNKEGVIAGLEKTGGVITSAGLILAGTFSALMALPLETLFQLGFTVALGLLVDTFLVRAILVPSIAFQLGDRNWWPGRTDQSMLGHGGE
ncbi:MAG: MMPL family transporter [Actinobacteria bacterium]|nr:MMPL family transporter [Actinomycetota bacterium]